MSTSPHGDIASAAGLRVCRHIAGAAHIIVTGIERDVHKIELAKALGATHTIVADRENVVDRVMELTGGQGVDVVVEAVPGVGQALVDAIDCVRIGGTIVLGLKGADQDRDVDDEGRHLAEACTASRRRRTSAEWTCSPRT